MKKVSVIIPNKQGRELRCLESIENQNYPEIEMIVEVDKSNQGAAATRNAGEKKAKGELLFFCDDDVMLEPDLITKMVDVMDKTNVDFVYCDYNRAGALFGTHEAMDWNPDELRKDNYISTMSLIKREKFPGFRHDCRMFDDWDLFLTMAEQGCVGYHLPYTGFTAFFNEGDISMANARDSLFWKEWVRELHELTIYDYSIVIVARNNLKLLKQYLESVLAFTGGSYEILIMANRANPNVKEFLDTCDYAKVHETRENYCDMVSMAFDVAYGDYLCMLRDDCIVTPNWNHKLRNSKDIKSTSCTGPMTSFADSFQRIHKMVRMANLVGFENIIQVQKELNEVYDKKAMPAKICSFCFFTSKIIWRNVGKLDSSLGIEAAVTDWICRGFLYNHVPNVNQSVYVHNYNALAHKEDDFWKHDRPELYKRHPQGMKILEEKLNDDLIKKFADKRM